MSDRVILHSAVLCHDAQHHTCLQANGLAAKAMDKIAAAQHSLANSPSTSPKGSSPIGSSPSGVSPSAAGASPPGLSIRGDFAPRQRSHGGTRQYNSPLRLDSEPSQLLRLIREDSGTHNSEEAVRAEEQSASHQSMLGYFHQQQSKLPQGQLQAPQQGQPQSAQGSMQLPQEGISIQPLTQAEAPQHASNPGLQAASMCRTDQQLGAQGSSAASVQQQR